MHPCPCWNNKEASTATAIWTLVYCVIFIALLGWQTSVVSSCQDSFIESDFRRCQHVSELCPCTDSMSEERYNVIINGAFIIQISNLVLLAVLFLSVGLLFLGINTNGRQWLWIFMVIMPISVLAMVIFCILWWSSNVKGGFIAITVLAFLAQIFNVLGFLVVTMFYKELRDREPKKRRTVVYREIYPDEKHLIEPRHSGSGRTKESPGVIVYHRDGSPAQKMMYARARVYDEQASIDDSGYRSSPITCPSGKDYNDNRQSVHHYEREIKPGSRDDTYHKEDDSSDVEAAEPRITDNPLDRTNGYFTDGLGTDDRAALLPSGGKKKLFPDSVTAVKGTPAPTANRSFGESSDSDSDDDGSLITHGHARRKRRGSKNQRSYRKRSMDGYYSESEANKNGSKSPHHRRIVNRHRRSKHYDSDHEICMKYARSKSATDLVAQGHGAPAHSNGPGYHTMITIPHNIVIPANTSNVRVNSEVNLQILPPYKTARETKQPISSDEVIV